MIEDDDDEDDEDEDEKDEANIVVWCAVQVGFLCCCCCDVTFLGITFGFKICSV